MTSLNYPADFQEFWNAYPRREAKIAALRAWKKLGSVNGLLPIILASIAEHRKTRQWQNKDFIPLPGSFLNGRRFEDELPSTHTIVDKPLDRKAIIEKMVADGIPREEAEKI